MLEALTIITFIVAGFFLTKKKKTTEAQKNRIARDKIFSKVINKRGRICQQLK